MNLQEISKKFPLNNTIAAYMDTDSNFNFTKIATEIPQEDKDFFEPQENFYSFIHYDEATKTFSYWYCGFRRLIGYFTRDKENYSPIFESDEEWLTGDASYARIVEKKTDLYANEEIYVLPNTNYYDCCKFFAEKKFPNGRNFSSLNEYANFILNNSKIVRGE